MNTSVRGKRDSRGFSLMELLVTIIIAGIAFAALVPVFVQAEQKTSADNMRNLALNLAQDKIERVRGLSYSVITETNLQENNSNVGAQFGPRTSEKLDPVLKTRVPVNLDNNGGRQLTIHYAVQDSTGTTALTAYKTVTVTVWWEGNPAPVKPVLLKTVIYSQYAGPQLIAPMGIAPPPDANDWITNAKLGSLTAITFTATVNDAQADKTWGVRFVVTDPSGGVNSVALSGTRVVLVGPPPESTPQSTPQWTASWPIGIAGSVPDGYYIVTATAYALNPDGTAGMPGNALTRDVRLERNPPGPVTPTALAGDGIVNLSWGLLASEGVVSYRIYRSDTPGGEDSNTYTEVSALVNCYRDTSVVNNPDLVTLPLPHKYYYKVIAVDVNGNQLPLNDLTVVECLATPAPIALPTLPAAVTVTSASYAAQSIPLMWSHSADATVIGYYVYRDRGAQPVQYVPHASLTTSSTWTDSGIDWGTEYTYTVRAITNAGVQGPIAFVPALPKDASGWVQVTLPPTPTYRLSVQVNQSPLESHTARAQLLNANGVVISTFPATETLAIPGGFATFAGVLPFGSYRIVLDPGTNKSQSLGIKLTGDPADSNTVYFNL